MCRQELQELKVGRVVWESDSFVSIWQMSGESLLWIYMNLKYDTNGIFSSPLSIRDRAAEQAETPTST